MEKLSDRMYLILEEFIQIEHELKKQTDKLGSGDIFFSHGSFNLETPNDPDANYMDIITILECVHHLLEDYETKGKK